MATVTHQKHSNDQLDAARALLDVCPSVTESTVDSGSNFHPAQCDSSSSTDWEFRGVAQKKIGALDALAALASRAQDMQPVSRPAHSLSGFNSVSSSSDDDSEAMPPPPPRRRPRSVSNPEGMEKWDSLNPRRNDRLHFVLPSSILEEELAEANAAAERQKEKSGKKLPIKKRGGKSDLFGTSPNSVTSPIMDSIKEEEDEPTIPEIDEADMTPEDLLRRARSRLLEDLSEGSLNGEKGVLTLPHSLSKYKEVYNKNGRIGIYTPAERAAIIARFSRKRSRRMWKKKIRYNCRKNLADRRMRVKGRFVKRSTEEMAKTTTVPETAQPSVTSVPALYEETPSSTEVPKTEDCVQDVDMPDVNDPEAGFAPTEDQPFRRLRRHTIT